MEAFTWLASDLESFTWAENCLPPRALDRRGGWYFVLVGEASDHAGPRGTARYRVHAQHQAGRCVRGSRPIAAAELGSLVLP